MKNLTTVSTILITCVLISRAPTAFGQPNPQGRPSRPSIQSPASQPRPKPAVQQTYPAGQVREGEGRFGSQCGFCHGKDAAGGESGPDLTRSELVANDVNGDKLGPFIRNGRPNAGMPAFSSLTADEMKVVVAFMHSQMEKFAELGGGRRSVEPSDLATGNANAGREYFNVKGKCSACHSPT